MDGTQNDFLAEKLLSLVIMSNHEAMNPLNGILNPGPQNKAFPSRIHAELWLQPWVRALASVPEGQGSPHS